MNDFKYKHTIFTPVYNRADGLQDVYRSIQELDYPAEHFEWLIIDDGSTDHIKEVIAGFSPVIHIRVIHKSNEGIHISQNLAIKLADGEYCTRIDSDDVIAPDALRNMDLALEKVAQCSGRTNAETPNRKDGGGRQFVALSVCA